MTGRWIVAAVLCVACKSDKPPVAAETKTPSQQPIATEPDMCELFVRAVDRLGACAKLRDAMRDTYTRLAREVQDTPERPFGKGVLAKCQMSLHMLRTDVKLDCPELVHEIPDVEIP